jgi:hypothetical protein
MKKKIKRKNSDETIITCPKCQHQHYYESFDLLYDIPNSTPCESCGYLFLDHISKKLRASISLRESDSKAKALYDSGDLDAFHAYLAKKTGLF